MFGVELDDPAGIFCDNESMVKKKGDVESMFNEKPSAIAYHNIRWFLTAGLLVII